MSNIMTVEMTVSKSEQVRRLLKANPDRTQYWVAKQLGFRPQFVSNIVKAMRLKAAKTELTLVAEEIEGEIEQEEQEVNLLGSESADEVENVDGDFDAE